MRSPCSETSTLIDVRLASAFYVSNIHHWSEAKAPTESTYPSSEIDLYGILRIVIVKFKIFSVIALLVFRINR